MNVVRRSAAALAAIAVIGAAAPAVAASPSPSASAALPDGLYGSADPKYDGVWRQSLALLAQHQTGVTPATKAVDWLAGQQCADGSFAAFRADVSKDCDAKVMADTNSTAAAVQALAALGGHGATTGQAVTWLKSVQNKDGGWGYSAGGPSDANSTSVVIGALAAAGQKPEQVTKDGKSPYDALLTFALPCDGTDAGAFAFQPDKKGKLAANADATAAAVVGAVGKGLTGSPEMPAADAASCKDARDPAQAAQNGAAYLTKALAKNHHLTTALPGAKPQPDYGNTADAVLALSTVGQGPKAAGAVRWLEANAGPWAKQAGPAAYAELILAAKAYGANVHDFGGQDLVELLDATGPKPAATAVPSATPASGLAADQQDDAGSNSGFGAWWIVGVFLVAGIGFGFLLSARNRK